MTHEQRAERRKQILAWNKEGKSKTWIIAQTGLHPQYVNTLILNPEYCEHRKSRYKGKTRTYTLSQQKANNAELKHKWAIWAKTHQLRCNRYPAGKCTSHKLLGMEIIWLPKGKMAILCTGKLIANWQRLGLKYNPHDRKYKSQFFKKR